MKKELLISASILLMSAATAGAQGWIGNSATNTIYPVNSSLGLSPVDVGIGTNAPTEQLHTTAGVRFQGLTKVVNPPRIVVQDNNGVLNWANPSTIGNFWSLDGNTGTVPGTVAGQNYLG